MFNDSFLGRALENGDLNLPRPKTLPGTDIISPHVIVGDAAFVLKPYLMAPYNNKNKRTLSVSEEIFNYRHSRCRRIIECAFGILKSKWRIFDHPIVFKLSVTETMVMCVVALHNFIITSEMHLPPRNQNYKTTENLDVSSSEDSDGEDQLPEAVHENNDDFRGNRVREILKNYFISDEGAVPFQWERI